MEQPHIVYRKNCMASFTIAVLRVKMHCIAQKLRNSGHKKTSVKTKNG